MLNSTSRMRCDRIGNKVTFNANAPFYAIFITIFCSQVVQSSGYRVILHLDAERTVLFQCLRPRIELGQSLSRFASQRVTSRATSLRDIAQPHLYEGPVPGDCDRCHRRYRLGEIGKEIGRPDNCRSGQPLAGVIVCLAFIPIRLPGKLMAWTLRQPA